MTESPLSSDLIVADVLRRWPATIRVFARRRMACVGCAMAPFMTLEEAARSHGMEPATFLADLRRSVGERDRAGAEEEARP
jgi:hybrid cluster-associated redox disulfide protein